MPEILVQYYAPDTHSHSKHTRGCLDLMNFKFSFLATRDWHVVSFNSLNYVNDNQQHDHNTEKLHKKVFKAFEELFSHIRSFSFSCFCM